MNKIDNDRGSGQKISQAESNNPPESVNSDNTVVSGSDNPEIKRARVTSPNVSFLVIVLLGIFLPISIVSILINFSFILNWEFDFLFLYDSIGWLFVVGLIIITTLSLILAFWVLYMRSLYLKDGPALVPEKWGFTIQQLIEALHSYSEKNTGNLKKINELVFVQEKKTDELMESFFILRDELNKRDEEIARLKKGYDAKIYRNFLLRFIRIDRHLDELENKEEESTEKNTYKRLGRLMEDALEECGVEKFSPDIGCDIRDAGAKISDDVVEIFTTDSEKDYCVAEVLTVGYLLQGQGKSEIISPAKVSINRLQSDKGGINE